MEKSGFPIFKNHPNLIYLDSAATTQKPQVVIDKLIEFYTQYNSNIHRGLYPIAVRASDEYENARKIIAEFINAESDEIIFTSGTTLGINMIKDMLQNAGMINEQSRILLTESEHHSNILPWQTVTKNIDYISLNQKYEYETEKYNMSDYDLISVSHVNNVTGALYPASQLAAGSSLQMITKNKIPDRRAYRQAGAEEDNQKPITENQQPFTILDASQSIAHIPIDVKKLDADFIVFSGHKAYGPTGVGAIWGRKELLKKLNPSILGGGMIREVFKDHATWDEIPHKFEAGTPAVAEAIALGSALKFIKSTGFDFIQKHEQEIKNYALENLASIPKLKIVHSNNPTSLGVISFAVDKIHPHDIAQYLGDNNICIRAGHHCTQIFHRDVLKIPASCRISLGMYNTKEDIDILVTKLKEALEIYH